MPASLVHSLDRYRPPHDATIDALISRLETVIELDRELREAGYAIHKEDGIYETVVVPGLEFWQILYEAGHGIDRDMQRLLQLSVDMAIATALQRLEEQGPCGELGPWETGARNIDSLENWITLLRDHLRTFKGAPDDFMVECREAFPDFVFSSKFPGCLETFKGNLKDFIAEIVSALISLAEEMPKCMTQPTTHECMKAFTAVSGYETSMEGNAERKDALTFDFTGKDGTVKILCEPHIKLHCSSRAGDTEYYFHRIYFSTAEHDDFPQKTLIGHIGEHL